MNFTNTSVMNFVGAMRGLRNPLESWSKSDSYINNSGFIIGENDLGLAQRLIKSGSEHRKFLRQIMVSVDITAPLYWWKEFDTYKINVTTNSSSTMHKLDATKITRDCFEMSGFSDLSYTADVVGEEYDFTTERNWDAFITILEALRIKHLETKDKRYWKELIRLLPSSWLQTRTVTMNYENVLNMIKQRKNHKLTEWSTDFIYWAKELPYAEDFLFIGGDK